MTECIAPEEYAPSFNVRVENGSMLYPLLLAVFTCISGYFYGYYTAEQTIRDADAKRIAETLKSLNQPTVPHSMNQFLPDRQT